MINSKVRDVLFFLLCFTLPFIHIPEFLRLKFILLPDFSRLSNYPLFLGMLYTAYCQIRYRNVFANESKFFKYVFVYILIISTSLFLGLYQYPYYEWLLAGNANQIENLPQILTFLNNNGIGVVYKELFIAWFSLRNIKTVFVDAFFCYGCSYMVYCWYRNDYQQGLKIFKRSLYSSVAIFILYGLLDVAYLAHFEFARSLLINATPYVHVVETMHGWYPPLLWNGQLRSFFVEPSFIGNYIACILPVLWTKLLFSKNKVRLEVLFTFMVCFYVVLTKARTAMALYVGMLVVFFVLVVVRKYRGAIMRYFVLTVITATAFCFGVYFINYFDNNSKKLDSFAVQSEKVLDENLMSLGSGNKRSNGARYAVIKSSLRTWSKYPMLGVGINLGDAYIIQNFNKNEKENPEVKRWIDDFYKLGGAKSRVEPLNEYVRRITENGVVGLSVFILPFAFALYKLFIMIIKYEQYNSTSSILLFTTLLGSCIAAMNIWINVYACSWIILGLSFAFFEERRI